MHRRSPVALNLTNQLMLEVFKVPAGTANKEFEILNQIAAINIHCVDDHHRNLLHYAVIRNENINILNFILERGLSIFGVDVKHRTALHYAALTGNNQLVNFLLKKAELLKATEIDEIKGDSTNQNDWINLADDQGETALLSAVRAAAPPNQISRDAFKVMIQMLIESGADKNSKNQLGQNALHLAVSLGVDDEIVEDLLNFNIAGDAQDKNGHTVLHYAALNGNDKLIQLLLKKKQLSEAAKASETKDDSTNQTDWINLTDDQGETALLSAVRATAPPNQMSKNAFRTIIKLLIQYGADKNSCNQLGQNALHLAASLDVNYEMIEDLLNCDIARDAQDKNGHTPLHDAVSAADEQLVKLLLTKPLLFDALRGGTEAKDEIPIQRDLVNITDDQGETALLLLVRLVVPPNQVQMEKFKAILKLLIDYGADKNSKNLLGQNALHLAVLLKVPHEVIEDLLSCDIAHDAQDQEGRTPLHYTVLTTNYVASNILLLHHLYKIEGDLDDIKRDYPDIIDNYGNSALLLAIKSEALNHYERKYRWYTTQIILQLIFFGADRAMCDSEKNSVLHYACMFGELNIAKLLLGDTEALGKKTFESFSPSRPATKYLEKNAHHHLHNRVNSGQQLSSKTAEINALNIDQATPLQFAINRNHSPLVAYLLKKKAVIFDISSSNPEEKEANIGNVRKYIKEIIGCNHKIFTLVVKYMQEQAEKSGIDLFSDNILHQDLITECSKEDEVVFHSNVGSEVAKLRKNIRENAKFLVNFTKRQHSRPSADDHCKRFAEVPVQIIPATIRNYCCRIC